MIDLNFPGPVTSENGFFDRRKEWARIERAFRTGSTRSVIIQGDRRIGKTTLQTVAAKRLEKDETLHFAPLFLSPDRHVNSVVELSRVILNTLCARLGRNPQETELVDDEGCFSLSSGEQFWQEIKQLVVDAPDQIFLICIDEFDALLKTCPPVEQGEILDLFQVLIERRVELPLRLFLSMTNLEFTEIDLPGSPLVSKAEVVELRCFPFDDTSDMVQALFAPQADISSGGVECLYTLSGGHPYVAKLLLANLLETYGFEARRVVVDRTTVEDAAASAVDDPRARNALANLYDVHMTAEEKGLLLLLAERQTSITRKELEVLGPDYAAAARSLARRDFLEEKVREEYHLRITFLGRWLHHWERYESEADKWLRDVHRRLQRMEHPWEGIEEKDITVVSTEDLRRFGLRP